MPSSSAPAPTGSPAALTLARAGLRVEVREGAATLGGGCRTEALTLPGFTHDVCSTVHPLLAASPFFRRADLGLELLTPRVAFAHPLDGGRRSLSPARWPRPPRPSAATPGAYARAMGPLVEQMERIVPSVLGPMLRPPRHPIALARFGLLGLLPARGLAAGLRTAEARALLAGLAAHSMRPLSAPGTGAFALLLGMLAHGVGWPVVAGGSARITDAITQELERRGATAADRQLGSGPRGALRRAAEASRRHPAGVDRDRRDEARRLIPAGPRALQLRPGRLQGRLGALRPGSLDGRGLPRDADAPHRRHLRGDRPGRGRGRIGHATRSGRSASPSSRR